MNQISLDQIVDNGIPENTVKPIPRDLADVKSSSSGKSGLGFINNGGASIESIDAPLQDSPSNPISMPRPETPQLIAIKSQTVKIKDDGTYAIDVIIEVEDIKNVSDYEVRISKSAGTI